MQDFVDFDWTPFIEAQDMAKKKFIRSEAIEIDMLLNGTPTWEQVVEWFKETSDDEHWVVAAIKKHLLTEEQRKLMFEADISIEDLLNGRVQIGSDLVTKIFNEWNAKLGRKQFGWY